MMMEIVRSVKDLRDRVGKARIEGKAIGFVPTMGALHAGHLSLVEQAKVDNGFAVVSVFVNPTQFAPGEDYEKYPRNLEADAEQLQSVGADLLFAPDVDEMYPSGFNTHIDVDGITSTLEGATRIGHFRGVATVVLKLFNMVQPDRAYFGMKDYQQLQVIRKMVRDLNVNIEIVGMPTVREEDGLAMSSRNAYLNPAERKTATVLYQVLQIARERITRGERDASGLRMQLEEIITAEPNAEIDYVAIADPETLEPIADIEGPVLVALAVRVGNTRLIDNTVIEM